MNGRWSLHKTSWAAGLQVCAGGIVEVCGTEMVGLYWNCLYWGPQKIQSWADKASKKGGELRDEAEDRAHEAKAKADKKAGEAKAKADKKADEL